MCKPFFFACVLSFPLTAAASPMLAPDSDGRESGPKQKKSESQQVLVLAEPSTVVATGLGLTLLAWHRRRSHA